MTASNRTIHTREKHLTIRRLHASEGFSFEDTARASLSTDDIHRIEGLGIPPSWEDVKISNNPRTHIQAVGVDGTGKKQYIYHIDWVQERKKKKFEKQINFGERLSALRKVCSENLAVERWSLEKVLSLAVCLLDHTGMRVGHQKYSEANGTYGLTTLRRRHLTVEEQDDVKLTFTGKSGIAREVPIHDETLASHIIECSDRPGYELFRYKLLGKWKVLSSDQVNEFIAEVMDGDFTSKDFRTWVAGRKAIEVLPRVLLIHQQQSKKERHTLLAEEVAVYLGNRPSTCLSHYIHPDLIEYIKTASDADLSLFLSKKQEISSTDVETRLSEEEVLLLRLMILMN